MNSKRLVLFGASAAVLAGALVYALGIYPPASSRDGRGAIGQRHVYRATQASDANVNPNDAPVAAQAAGTQVQPGLQNGQVNSQVVAAQGNNANNGMVEAQSQGVNAGAIGNASSSNGVNTGITTLSHDLNSNADHMQGVATGNMQGVSNGVVHNMQGVSTGNMQGVSNGVVHNVQGAATANVNGVHY